MDKFTTSKSGSKRKLVNISGGDNDPLRGPLRAQQGPDIVLLVPDRLTAAFAYHIVIDAKLPGKIAGYPGRQHRAGNFQLCPRTGDKPHAVNHGGESAKLIGQRLHGATGDVDGEEGGSGVGQRLMVCRPQLAGFIPGRRRDDDRDRALALDYRRHQRIENGGAQLSRSQHQYLFRMIKIISFHFNSLLS